MLALCWAYVGPCSEKKSNLGLLKKDGNTQFSRAKRVPEPSLFVATANDSNERLGTFGADGFLSESFYLPLDVTLLVLVDLVKGG